MADMISYYYPVGPYGPICDYVAPEVLTPTGGCKVDADCPPGFRCVDGKCVPIADDDTIFDPPKNDPYTRWPRVTCKRDPVTKELYDCQAYWDTPLPVDPAAATAALGASNWAKEGLVDFGINDKFFVVSVGPQSCQPYDPDINIRPLTFIDSDGNKIIRQAYQNSTPVTYPVDGSIDGVNAEATGASPSLIVKFNYDGTQLEVTGRGSGQVSITVSWSDNPSTDGVAFDTITINTVQFVRSGNDGSVTKDVFVAAEVGYYTIAYTNLNPSNTPIKVTESFTKLELKDGGGNDTNATVKIGDVYSPIQADSSSGSLWSETADEYAVWVNPEECTLPCAEQEVTYLINFPETATYFFEFAADDIAYALFDAEETAFMNATTPTIVNPDKFSDATGPTIVSRSVTAGQHKIVVKCTNGASGGDASNSYYINNTITWGSITLGPGTAIYTAESGYAPTTSGTGYNEMGGFSVPADSTTNKYLSFGTREAGPTVANRSAQITTDLSNVGRLVFGVIAGNDSNGGERPNNYNDTWDVSFDNTNWIQVAPSKQYSGMERAEYDATYGSWYDFSVNVPTSARTSNSTIYFRSSGTSPEYGTGYNGLNTANSVSTYANGGDVYGLYKIEKITNVAGTCANIHPNAYDWSKNPGGWYIKICKDAPCIVASEISGWVKVVHGAWTPLLNNYGVYPSLTQQLTGQTHTINYTVYCEIAGVYTLNYAVDNQGQWYWDGVQVAAGANFTSQLSTTISNVTVGSHTITMKVTNVPNGSSGVDWIDNPAGGAFTLVNPNGKIVKTSADLTTTADGNLIWHTRLATGYRYA